MDRLEFAAAAAPLTMAPELREAARRVLVDGETQAAVRQALGLRKQAVYYWITRVTKSYAELMDALMEAAPEGWRVGLIALPPSDMERTKALEALARATLRLQKANHGEN